MFPEIMRPALKTFWLTVVVLPVIGIVSGCLSVPKTDALNVAVNHRLPIETLPDAELDSEAELRQNIRSELQQLQSIKQDTPRMSALASKLILLSAAHTNKRSEKRKLYLQAMAICELAMLQHPNYAAEIAAGKAPWEACTTLDQAYLEPMFFWATAMLYTFREGITPPMQLLHAKWLGRVSMMLERMAEIDRDWHGGAILFSQAIVKFAVPESFGGDKVAAWELVNEAAAYEDGWMLSKWGRAVYFHTASEDVESYQRDLIAITKIDPNLDREHSFWRKYFYLDASQRLTNVANENNN